MKLIITTFRSHPFLWSILAIGIILRFAFVIFLPFGNTVRGCLPGEIDEQAHYAYSNYLFTEHQLPVLTTGVFDPMASQTLDFEYHQPPAYYMICTVLRCIAGSPNDLYAGRFLSFVFGVLSILLIYLIFKHLQLPGGLAAAAFTSILIPHMYFCALFSNDSISWFIALLLSAECIFYLTYVKNNKHPPIGKAIRTGAYLAIGLLTKSSLLPFVFICGGTLVYAWAQSRSKEFIKHGAIILGTGIVCALPWYIRNYMLYASLFGVDFISNPSGTTVLNAHKILYFAKSTICFFWFPSIHVAVSPVITALHGIQALFCTVFFAAAIVYGAKQRLTATGWFMILTLILFAGALLQYNIAGSWRTAEARFLFPALLSIVFLIVVPIKTLFKEKYNHIAEVLIFVPAALSYLTFAFVKFAQ